MMFIHEFPLILKANENKKEQPQKGMIWFILKNRFEEKRNIEKFMKESKNNL